MSTTAEASVARRTGRFAPTAGVGPAEQRTVVKATTGALSAAGGEVLLAAASAGTYTLPLPFPNTVSLKITDLGGHAHVLTTADGHTYTWNGAAGSFLELMATADEQWSVGGANGVSWT